MAIIRHGLEDSKHFNGPKSQMSELRFELMKSALLSQNNANNKTRLR